MKREYVRFSYPDMKGLLITLFWIGNNSFSISMDALRHAERFHNVPFAFNSVDLLGALVEIYHGMALMRY